MPEDIDGLTIRVDVRGGGKMAAALERIEALNELLRQQKIKLPRLLMLPAELMNDPNTFTERREMPTREEMDKAIERVTRLMQDKVAGPLPFVRGLRAVSPIPTKKLSLAFNIESLYGDMAYFSIMQETVDGEIVERVAKVRLDKAFGQLQFEKMYVSATFTSIDWKDTPNRQRPDRAVRSVDGYRQGRWFCRLWIKDTRENVKTEKRQKNCNAKRRRAG